MSTYGRLYSIEDLKKLMEATLFNSKFSIPKQKLEDIFNAVN